MLKQNVTNYFAEWFCYWKWRMTSEFSIYNEINWKEGAWKKSVVTKPLDHAFSCTPSSYGALGKFGEQKNAVVSFTILILIKFTIHRPSLKMLKLLLASTLSNSYTFMLSKLPACTITVWCTLKHEPIIIVNFKNVF